MDYTLLLYAGLYSLSASYYLLQSLICLIEALLFSKKLVFRVGKKAMAGGQALL